MARWTGALAVVAVVLLDQVVCIVVAPGVETVVVEVEQVVVPRPSFVRVVNIAPGVVLVVVLVVVPVVVLVVVLALVAVVVVLALAVVLVVVLGVVLALGVVVVVVNLGRVASVVLEQEVAGLVRMLIVESLELVEVGELEVEVEAEVVQVEEVVPVVVAVAELQLPQAYSLLRLAHHNTDKHIYPQVFAYHIPGIQCLPPSHFQITIHHNLDNR